MVENILIKYVNSLDLMEVLIDGNEVAISSKRNILIQL